jgi:hypothetical protein
MSLLARHVFTGGAGAYASSGVAFNTVGGGTYSLGAPSGGTLSLDGAGYLSGSSSAVEVQINGAPALDYVIAVKCRYIGSTNGELMKIGLMDTGSATQRYWSEILYSTVNKYSFNLKKVSGAIVSNTGAAEGNPPNEDIWVYLIKNGSTFYQLYDIGNGPKRLVTATDSTYTVGGLPFFSVSTTWKVAEIMLFDATDRGFVITGFDPTTDPRNFANLIKHFDFTAELANTDPRAASWLIQTSGQASPWTNATGQTGQFGGGISFSTGSGASAVRPAFGLIPARSFTVGCWIKITTAWASWAGGKYWLEIGNAGTFGDMIRVGWSSATQFKVQFNKAAGGKIALTTVTYDFPYGIPALNSWNLFGISMRADGKAEILFNSVICHPTSGTLDFAGTAFHDSAWWECSGTSDGIKVLYDTVGGTRCPNATLSDLFIAYGAHLPGHAVPSGPTNTLTVTPGSVPSGVSLSYRLLGALGNSATSDVRSATKGKLGIVRYDKILNACQAERSSGGNSSLATTAGRTASTPWWWKWTPLYNVLDWSFGHAEGVHIDLDSVPYRLQSGSGPTQAYFNNADVLVKLPASLTFAAAVPDNGTNTGTIAGGTMVLSAGTIDDFAMAACDCVLEAKAYCLAQGYDFTRITWGWWNEGNTAASWRTGTGYADTKAAQFSLWKAITLKVQAQSGLSAWSMDYVDTTTYDATWIPYYMAQIHANSLDASGVTLHCHGYQGIVYGFHDYLLRQSETDRVAQGMTSAISSIYNGEDNWSSILVPGFFSQIPASDATYSFHCKALGAAWLSHAILSAAKSQANLGSARSIKEFIFTNLVEFNPLGSNGALSSFGTSGLAKADATPHAPLNCYDLLQRLCTDWPGTSGRAHGTTAWSGIPGVGHLCTTLADGTVRVLLSHYKWDKTQTVTLTVGLGATYAGRSVSKYVIDDSHASQYDTAGVSTNLASASAGTLDGSGNLALTLRGASVTMLEIAPAGSRARTSMNGGMPGLNGGIAN